MINKNKNKTSTKTKAKTETKTKAKKPIKPPQVKSVTKRDIIHALKTEPLQRGSWVELRDLETVGNCKVCAVGAVLRAGNMTNKQIDLTAGQVCKQPKDYSFDASRIRAVVSAKAWLDKDEEELRRRRYDSGDLFKDVTSKYLTALTVLFEGQSSKSYVTKEERQELVDFVDAFFPEDLELDLKAVIKAMKAQER